MFTINGKYELSDYRKAQARRGSGAELIVLVLVLIGVIAGILSAR